MKDNLEVLKELAVKAQQMTNVIRDKINTLENIPKAKALVGQCFKYPNSYSSSENWWMYIKVTRHDKEDIFIDSFEEDSNEVIKFEFDRPSYLYQFSNSNYISILPEEYDKAKKDLLKKLKKQLGEK